MAAPQASRGPVAGQDDALATHHEKGDQNAARWDRLYKDLLLFSEYFAKHKEEETVEKARGCAADTAPGGQGGLLLGCA